MTPQQRETLSVMIIGGFILGAIIVHILGSLLVLR
jgi:hypothetical protein